MSSLIDNPNDTIALTLKRVLKTWLPLVASWMLMSIELPFITAIIARLPNPEVNLAAYGGVSYTVALTIEAPVIMLLAASTALSRDWYSYQKLRKYTLFLSGFLTIVHLIVTLTPIFDFITGVLLAVPKAVVEPARLGLIFLTPWSLGIAFRRFQQGAMIRFEQTHMVGETTVVRLITVGIVLLIGSTLRTIPGTALAGLAHGLGVSVEAIYAGLRIRKVHPKIKLASPVANPLNIRLFIRFYFPLALTSSLGLLWQPFISSAVSRMPNPLESLAVWSVITGLLFLFRSPGLAYNEAVVALLEERGAFKILRKFTLIASLVTVFLSSIIVITPLSRLWFTYVANLAEGLVPLAMTALALGVPLSFLGLFISLYQGVILHSGKTSAVPEAVVIFLIVLGAILITGVFTQIYEGVFVAVIAYVLAHLAQALWLFLRSGKPRHSFSQGV